MPLPVSMSRSSGRFFKRMGTSKSSARIGGHPLHPVLVSLPIGLWTFSFVCDLAGLIQRENYLWQSVAFYALAGGIAGALLAAIPGAIDLLALKRSAERRTAIMHMAINIVMIAIFCGDLALRVSDAVGIVGPIVVSAIGMTLVAISGWLGGELVYHFGVGVEDR